MQELKGFDEMFTEIFSYLSNPALWFNFGIGVLKIVTIVIAAKISMPILEASINRVFQRRESGKIKFDRRRVDTLRVLVNHVARYTIYFITILLVVFQLGFDLRPVLVSAGVLGLAVGFGAQSLVRDVITGFFIIFEDQFAVGDFVTINTFNGTVQEIGLRITKIRSSTGELHIIPNGSINQVTNFSLQNTIAVLDISVAYEENIEHVQAVIAEVAKKAQKENQDIVNDPQVLGVQSFGPTGVTIRVTVECKPNTHYGVARKLRAMIKEEFEAKGIEIPNWNLATLAGKE